MNDLCSRSQIIARKVCLFSVVVGITISALPSSSAARPTIVANVVIFSKKPSSSLITSIEIDSQAIEATVVTNASLSTMNDTQYTSLLSAADLFMIDRFLPGGQRLESLVEQVNGTNGNKGLVMFGIVKHGDANNTRDMNSSQISLVSPILPVLLNDSYQNSTDDPTDMNYNVQVKQVDGIPESSRVLTKTIAWGSAPQAERRTLISLQPGATVIITDITGNLPMLSEWRLNGGSGANVMFFSWEILEQNGALTVWPYFNYLMYACTFHSIHGYNDALIEPYDQWPHAPLPSTQQLAWWFTMIGAIWFVTIALFAYFKKHSPPSISRSQQSSDKPSKTGTKESLDPDSMLEGES